MHHFAAMNFAAKPRSQLIVVVQPEIEVRMAVHWRCGSPLEQGFAAVQPQRDLVGLPL